VRTWQVSKCTPYYPRHGHGPFYATRVLGHVVAADIDGAVTAARARWGNLSDLELEVQPVNGAA
jgi:hypothetical protein